MKQIRNELWGHHQILKHDILTTRSLYPEVCVCLCVLHCTQLNLLTVPAKYVHSRCHNAACCSKFPREQHWQFLCQQIWWKCCQACSSSSGNEHGLVALLMLGVSCFSWHSNSADHHEASPKLLLSEAGHHEWITCLVCHLQVESPYGLKRIF